MDRPSEERRSRTIKHAIVCGREYWMIYRGPGFDAFVYDLAPVHPLPPPPLPSASCLSSSAFLWVACRAYWRERGEGMGWARSQIIRPRKRLVLYKSFSSLWLEVSTPRTLSWRFLYVVFILIIQLTWREFVSFTEQSRGKFWSLHFPNRRLTASYFVRTVFNVKRCIYSKLHKTMREVNTWIPWMQRTYRTHRRQYGHGLGAYM